jgi:hypothetical protein
MTLVTRNADFGYGEMRCPYCADDRKRVEVDTARFTRRGAMNCPGCGSTEIHAAKRGWSFLTGMIGRNRIIMTCLNCGKRCEAGDPIRRKRQQAQNEAAAQLITNCFKGLWWLAVMFAKGFWWCSMQLGKGMMRIDMAVRTRLAAQPRAHPNKLIPKP